MESMEISPSSSATDGMFGFRAALDILSHPVEIQDTDSAVIACVDAFQTTRVSILDKYRAASYLCERDLRHVTQILVHCGLAVVSSAVRLLLIMRGLPGNDELAYTLLHPLSSDELASLDSFTLALVALLGGSFITSNFPTSDLLSRAINNSDTAAELALAIAYNVQPLKKEGLVSRVRVWDSEVNYAHSPSFWRELEWATFARTHCVAAGLQLSSTLKPTSAVSDNKTSWVSTLPSSFGLSAQQYVLVCGILMARRPVHFIENPDQPAAMITNVSREESNPDSSFVVIPSIQPVLRNVAIAIAHGLPLVLEGPTGCGKTALLSMLARLTAISSSAGEVPGVTFIQMDSVMSDGGGESVIDLVGSVVPLPEGGGFRWRPGPIGLAVERGEWVVLENLGKGSASSATAALVHRLATLRVGHTIEAPGRGEPIRVASGFRCIATRTAHTSFDNWQPPGGWDLWLRIKMKELSKEDIHDILQKRFPSVADCLERVVNCVSRVSAYALQFSSPIFVCPNMREMLRICSRLSQIRDSGSALTAEIALQETLDILVAWCPDEQHITKLVNITSESWSLSSKTGEHLLYSYSPSLSVDHRTYQIGRAQCDRSFAENESSSPSLALNSHTLRLLERLLRCVQMEENVLLTGEAGSGKTALVQELAESLGKKLVVVNLSRQSELSDLVGGFRPEEVSAAIPILARSFEQLFCSCLSRERNARFLDGLQKATRVSALHPRALRLMKGALKAMPMEFRSKSEGNLQQWADISREVDRLERIMVTPHITEGFQNTKRSESDVFESERPRKRPRGGQEAEASCNRRVLFRFSEGVLVQSMRAGHWILLDEINLAPSELLERLVSVVDKGEILLSNEKGEAVSHAPGFMFFGSMNPPTDAWKRPLPSVLRTRFSEIHVGDVQDHKDLTLLVSYRFFGSIKPRSNEENEISEDVAHFFLQCCSVSKEGRIEDMSGKPVRFSVRTLTRMLDFAKGLSMHTKSDYRVVRWALYEGAVVAFVTSLPRSCKEAVLRLSYQHILRSSKSGLKMRPLSSCHYTNVDWKAFIRNMERKILGHGVPEPVKSNASERKFVISPSVKLTLTDVRRAMHERAPKFPILLQGPTAAGKTSIVSYLAAITGTQLVRINNHEHTELSEYIGGYVVTEDGSLQFSEGPLVRAARSGYWILLDELNLAPPDVLEALNRLLDENREVFIPETGEAVKASPNFRLFATQNPPGLYGGRKELSRAFRSRFIEVHIDELPDEDLLLILKETAFIPKSFAKGMISVMRELQIRRRSTGVFVGREGYVTARDLFRWASRQPRSKEELAIHGFFLLGERARTIPEREVVRDTLVRKLGISQAILSDNYLYSLNSSCEGSASRECLDLSLTRLHLSRERLFYALEESGIVLTLHTCRMIILLLHCMANHEPTLLVGPTGSGKTTCCAVVCTALQKALVTVNCHRHTETSDIVGGFRPVRRPAAGGSLFEWSNGPLIEAMLNGSAFLIDEINMADDAVIERMNSVLEPERSLLLSEKGTVSADRTRYSRPDSIVAHPGFLALATMNPGGDFGKKELSPALRNRFTETWMPEPSTLNDYSPIIDHYFSKTSSSSCSLIDNSVRAVMLKFLSAIIPGNNSAENRPIDSPRITLRDLSAWCNFVVKSSSNFSVAPIMGILHGARLVFLDGLSVGALSGRQSAIEQKWWNYLVECIPQNLRSEAEAVKYSSSRPLSIELNQSAVNRWCLEVDGFHLWRNMQSCHEAKDFSASFCFTASNTTRNIARLLRAFCVGQQPILLEGPPGGGKTSLISALADKSGFELIRVNLSESTEISDLVGCDAPAEVHGTFSFHPGPLLSALQRGAWILIDELNLASQSVLEGLNSVLDHRRTLFVPELNEEFTAHDSFRVFGAQNPAVDGNGRRGLPRSFLNRFAKVWIEPPDMNDVLSIISALHPQIPERVAYQIIQVLMHLKTCLDSRVVSGTYGLRDALRWCDLLCELGSFSSSFAPNMVPTESCLAVYMDHCFDVIVLQGLHLPDHRAVAIAAFEKIFLRSWHLSNKYPAIYATSGGGLRIGISLLKPVGRFLNYDGLEPCDMYILSSRLRELQAFSLSLKCGWSTVLLSEALSAGQLEGKRLFKILGTLLGKKIRFIHGGTLLSSDDVVGGFCQQDVLWLIRRIHREWATILCGIISAALSDETVFVDNNLFVSTVACIQMVLKVSTVLACDTEDRLFSLAKDFLERSKFATISLLNHNRLSVKYSQNLQHLQTYQSELGDFLTSTDDGKFAAFEWRKSDLLTAIENGEWIFVENANQCPPAVLDRLNPLFERLSISSDSYAEGKQAHQKRMLLAEAPVKKDGAPIYLHPHPDFRMVFSVSNANEGRSNLGLSRALLDRSLCICIGDFAKEEHSVAFSSVGLSDTISKRTATEPSTSVQTDVYEQAMRARVSLCAQSSEYVNCPIINDYDIFPRTFEMTSHQSITASNSTARTTPFSLSFNPQLALLERDIYALKELSSLTEAVITDTVKSLWCSKMVTADTVERFYRSNVEINCTLRTAVLIDAAHLLLLGATSVTDIRLRVDTLDRFIKQMGFPDLHMSCQQLDGFRKCVSNYCLSLREDKAACISDLYGVPIDPLYALDFSSSAILEHYTNNSDLTQLQIRGKQFRAQILVIANLRFMWDVAMKDESWLNKHPTLFAQAKVALEISKDYAFSDDCDTSNYVILCFEIVQSVISSFDLILNVFAETPGWFSEIEGELLAFLHKTEEIGKVITSECTPVAVLPPLSKWVLHYAALKIPRLQGIPELSDLKHRAELLLDAVNRSLNMIEVLTIPKSDAGQMLEKKLYSSICDLKARSVQFSEIDAAAQAIISIRSSDVESSGVLMTTLSKLDTSLSRTPDEDVLCTQFNFIDHWSQVLHCTVVNRLWHLMFHYHGLSGGLSDVNDCYSLQSLLFQAKCVSTLRFHTVLATQRLFWTFNRPTSTSCLQEDQRFNLMKPYISSVLQEWYYKVCDLGTADKRVALSGVTHSLMRTARYGTKSQFWSLGRAWEEALCTFSLIIRGSAMINNSNDLSRQFILQLLILLLSDLKLLSKAECHELLDNRNEGQMLSPLILKLSGLLETGRIQCSIKCSTLRLINQIMRVEEKISFHGWSGQDRDSTRRTRHALLWVLSGFLRVKEHDDLIKSLMGMDPSDVAHSFFACSTGNMVKAMATRLAFRVIAKYRFGTDCVSESVPFSRLGKFEDEEKNHCEHACDRFIVRSGEKCSFDSYSTCVANMVSTLTWVSRENGLLSQVTNGIELASLESVQNQISMLEMSCKTVLEMFECNGSKAHFRDISVDFELGLSQCLYGFRLLQYDLDRRLVLADEQLRFKVDLLQTLLLFPQSAVCDKNACNIMVRKWKEVVPDGQFLLSCADYITNLLLRDGTNHIKELFKVSDVVFQAWKSSVLLDEEEAEQKSSLHILRDATNSEINDVAHNFEEMDGHEDEDFNKTFNPMSAEVEESLFGFVDGRDTSSTSELGSTNDPICGNVFRHLDSRAFWDLHRKIFPSDRITLGSSNPSSFLNSMTSLASRMYRVFSDVLVDSETRSNIWNSVLAYVILRRFSGQPNAEQYNFYKSGNLSELIEASAALRILYRSVGEMQKKSLQETGHHPVLVDLSATIQRVLKTCKSDSPLAVVVVGIENVLRKSDEWHRLFATRTMRLDSEVEKLSKLVVKWRRLEMDSWSCLLQERRARFEMQASKWFFLLYDVVINSCTLEKHTGNNLQQESLKLVDQFLRSSPSGEFSCRVNMVLSLSKHLSLRMVNNEEGSKIAQVLYTVGCFYSTYIPYVTESLSNSEKPIFTKLDEFRTLVKWTATADLGSAQNMPKGKDKHLEYVRLKAASEKTRRRLHKLCLEVDSVLRKPVYEYILECAGKIGYGTISESEFDKGKKDSSFSEKILASCESLSTFLGANTNFEILNLSLPFKPQSGLLSKSKHLGIRMGVLADKLNKHDGISLNCAARSMLRLRTNLKQRVALLRSCTDQSIQTKKRSLIELLRCLRHLGLSPFAFSSRVLAADPNFYFSSPSPTNYPDLDNIADELFVLNVKQVQRMYETSDSRVRNSDVSKDEAAKAVSFCNQLLTQAVTERRVLRLCSDNIISLQTEASALELMCELPSEDASVHKSLNIKGLEMLQNNIQRLKGIVEDFDVVYQMLCSSDLVGKHPSLIVLSETSQSDIGLMLRKHISNESREDLQKIRENVATCATAVRNVTESDNARLICKAALQKSSLFHTNLRQSFKKCLEDLANLSRDLKKNLQVTSHLSSSNVLSLLIGPTLEFLGTIINPPTEEDCGDNVYLGSNNLLEELVSGGNSIIEHTLIATQRMLSWAGLSSEAVYGTKQSEDMASDSQDDFQKNSVSASHKMILSFQSTSALSELSSLLSKNRKRVELFYDVYEGLERKACSDAIKLQNTLGQFIRIFLNMIMIPTVQNCAKYHSQSLAFLRTISSLFVGLFTEGYCRPADNSSNEIDGEDQYVSGAGFGDVGNGDLSEAVNVSKDVEDEEQLLGLQGDQDETIDHPDNNEMAGEDAFDMSSDFHGAMEDVPSTEQDEDPKDSENNDIEKQLSKDADVGKSTIDEQMWSDSNNYANSDADDVSEAKTQRPKSTELIAKDDNDALRQGTENKRGEQPPSDLQESEDDENIDVERKSDSDPNRSGSSDDEYDKENNERKHFPEGNPLPESDETQTKDTSMNQTNGVENNNMTEDLGENHTDDAVDDSKKPDSNSDSSHQKEIPENGTKGFNEGNDSGSDESDEAMIGDQAVLDNGRDISGDAEGSDANGDEMLDRMDLGHLTDSDNEFEQNSDGEQSSMASEQEGAIDGSINNSDQKDIPENSGDNEEVAKSMELMDGNSTTMQVGGSRQQAFSTDDQQDVGIDHGRDSSGPTNTPGLDSSGNEDVGNESNEGRQPQEDPESAGHSDRSHALRNLDTNPLRAMSDDELLKHWEDILHGITHENMTKDQPVLEPNESVRPGEKAQNWQLVEENGADDQAALAPVTDDQHKPLKVNDDESAQVTDDGQEPPKSIEVNESRESNDGNERQSRGFVENNSGLTQTIADKSEQDEERLGNDTCEVKDHPARRAVLNRSNIELEEANETSHSRNEFLNFQLRSGQDDTDMEPSEIVKQGTCDDREKNGCQKVSTEVLDENEASEMWRQLESKVNADAGILCEQLRLVLEATERSGLGGGYRSGKRLNMRKVIEFVASDFRKDRIWMRRVRAERRAYDVMIAIDDSASMSEGNAGTLALEAVALVMSALSKLEVGRVAVTSFGTHTQIVRNFDQELPIGMEDGGTLLRHFTFEQNETDVAELLQYICKIMGSNQGCCSSTDLRSSSDIQRFSLVFVISDGHVNQRDEIRGRVRKLKDSNVLVAFIILDGTKADKRHRQGSNTQRIPNNGGENNEQERTSIFDVKRVNFDEKGNMSVTPYMEDFPIPFYVVVHDVRELPHVISDALRHWIEMAST